jgi:UDP-glucose 4-epimerase
MKILVTGGAGYIGSALTYLLIEQGHQVNVIDDLSNGFKDNVNPKANFVNGSILDESILNQGLIGVDAVIHLAAKIRVEEGQIKPELYEKVNIEGTQLLLNKCKEFGVTKFVFASTAAVYGDPEDFPVTEESKVSPVNVYGETKLVIDQYLAKSAADVGLSAISFRFFNVGGALQTKQGEWLKIKHEGATHLIPSTLHSNENNPLHIFGNDWPTEDGTPARDYVHVIDIADAIIKSLVHLEVPGHTIINLGTANGSTVLQVAQTAEKVLNRKISYTFAPRRSGDSFALVTSNEKAKKILGWKPSLGLTEILRDANAELLANS